MKLKQRIFYEIIAYGKKETIKAKHQKGFTCQIELMRKRNILKRWYNSVDVLRVTGKIYEEKAVSAEEKSLISKTFFTWR
jgi:hypothetical protein